MIGYKYCAALDVGSERDRSALSVIARREVYDQRQPAPKEQNSPQNVISSYDLVFLHRFDLKTPYHVIREKCVEVLSHGNLIGNSHFVVDATGVGNPVVKAVLYDLAPISIIITSGHHPTPKEDGGYSVPKRDLVTTMQSVFQTGRIRIAKNLEFLEQLQKEVLGFKMKSRDGRQFGAETESTHDDLVMSLAIGLWYMERLYGYSMAAEDLLEQIPYDPFESYS